MCHNRHWLIQGKMGFDPNGMCVPKQGDRVNLYALVIYLPDPLGRFLDELRLEMVPDSNPHAHISVLPPRPLQAGPEAAIEQARQVVAGFPPFDIELGRIDIFPITDVIYISLDGGSEQLREMHRTLNRGVLAFREPFAYHPHLTLAQELKPDQVEPLAELASRRWREFRGTRGFRADRTMFVQNTSGNQWLDLAEGPLRAVPVG
jgi:2'-5' RNA ligase